jgi:mono/diheme cytochrome c family protein
MRFALIIAALAASGPAFAQDLAEGRAGYAAHCAVCHGTNARGDGPMASLLTIPPADLTGLSARNGGVFPMDRAIRRIDGTEDMAVHGGPMPLFGALLQGPSAAIVAPDGSEVVAPEAIVNIAAWLQGQQR